MYDFLSLSPYEFEELSCDLLSAELNVQFHNFATGRDKGIDLRYFPTVDKKWIVQCKRHCSNFKKLLTHLKSSELPKVVALAPERYILTTSVDLTAANADEIFELLKPHCQSPQEYSWTVLFEPPAG
jgi:hypothetical protein